jgi:Carbohydrate family 9 binding domain-like
MASIMATTAKFTVCVPVLAVSLGGYATESHDKDRSLYLAAQAPMAPVVDGIANEKAWQLSSWKELDQLWLGPQYSREDFQGRYKVLWTQDKLYFLGEFVDDVLIDKHRNPLERYWDDDTLEIFIDEDFSGGEHHYNHNAFAYHLSLDNQAIDIGSDRKPRAYNDHIESRWKQSGDKIIWEVSIKIYPDSYDDNSESNIPVALSAGKILGFMVAYCDNDGSELRENFIGSEYAAGDHKDRGYIDAGLFGALELVEQ